MASVDPIACVVVIMPPTGDVIAYPASRWRIQLTGLLGVRRNSISLAKFLSKYMKMRRTNRHSDSAQQRYLLTTRFKRFSFAELRKATKGFSDRTRCWGNSIQSEANQGEAEFLAEVNTIGRHNHMNLIEIWGYCVEGKHMLLVYEYMEHRSLAENLSSNIALDWEKKFEIAVGTAKGLAYLHDECLEWVLHCDVKPQNRLLHSDYQPKVADFGLSKLRNRVTGKSPTGMHSGEAGEHMRVVKLVKEKMMSNIGSGSAKESWIEELIDPSQRVARK
ncbi:hypothetical protein FH972_006765 [Carpinus fangiana]|uniref:Protein kinase domain-containing protein n=1 Tax=Carpinus fangiana TaxID=176857 RepID=A0A5N6QTL1_9ROSI|nr:hypothetical protein FH972_006765 [Carpinus fangiana]